VILNVGCSILVAISAEESILDTRTSIEYQESSIEMIVGVMTAQLHMQGPRLAGTHGVASLKEKRSIIKSVIGRLKSRFNVSIAEVDHQDNKTLAVIGVAMVCNETRFIDKQFDTIINFMQKDGRFYLGQIERETFNS